MGKARKHFYPTLQVVREQRWCYETGSCDLKFGNVELENVMHNFDRLVNRSILSSPCVYAVDVRRS
jgi:hypothetical protein